MKKICPSIMKVSKMRRIKRPVAMISKGISRSRMMQVHNTVMVVVIAHSITTMSQMR